MLSAIKVDGKVLGRRRPVFTDWPVPLPKNTGGEGSSLTLRDLIICVVRHEAGAFKDRQETRRLQKILSPADIRQGLDQGKVTMGDSALDQPIDIEAAVEIALMGFIDGLYYVFLDDVQQENLDERVYLKPNSRLTFLRLVALAGG